MSGRPAKRIRELARHPRRLALLVLLNCVAVLAVLAAQSPAGERTSIDTRQGAAVLSAGGDQHTAGILLSVTVLGEGLVERQLTGTNRVIRPGLLGARRLSAPPPTGVGSAAPGLAARLIGNWPNPLNPGTTIRFDLGRTARVSLRVYDVRGHLVRTLVDETRAAGSHQTGWDGQDDGHRPVASGIYLLVMRAGEYSARHKMVVLR